MIRLKSLLFELDWHGEFGRLLPASRPKTMPASLKYAYELHDIAMEWESKLSYKTDISLKDVEAEIRRVRELGGATQEVIENAGKSKLINATRMADGLATVVKEMKRLDGIVRILKVSGDSSDDTIDMAFATTDSIIDHLHMLLDFIATQYKNASPKVKMEGAIPQQTARNWQSTGCKHYDDAHDVCLDADRNEGADPGWSDAMAGTDRDAFRDKDDNTAWYEALNHAKSAVQELGDHIEAIRKVENVSPEQQTGLQIDQILTTMRECQEKLSRLVGDVKVFPHNSLFGEP